MFDRFRNGYSTFRVRKMSRGARESTVGNLNASGGPIHANRNQRMNASSVRFSNSRRQRRATKGEVDHIVPQARTRESESQFARRTKRQTGPEAVKRRALIQRILIAVLAVAVLAGVGIGVGVFVFNTSTNSKLAIGNENLKNVLAAQPSSGPYYALFTADFDEVSKQNPAEKPDVLLLARIDEQNKACTLVSIPANLQVRLSDGAYHDLADAVSIDGDDALIKAVNNFTGVSISHYAKIDRAGFLKLRDSIDPITVTITEEIDDPMAGPVYIPTGERVLSDTEVITYMKASNFTEGVSTRAINQCTYATLMCENALSATSFGRLSMIDSIAGSLKTDWTVSELADVADAFEGFKASDFLIGFVPGYETVHGTTSTFTPFTLDWQAVMAAVEVGSDPQSPLKVDTSGVDPGSFTVTVRNGTTITGLAGEYTDYLNGLGYRVEETGTTDSPSFDETLIIYKDDAHKAAAESIRQVIYIGRIIPSDGFYSFDTDVLLIIGGDRKAS